MTRLRQWASDYIATNAELVARLMERIAADLRDAGEAEKAGRARVLRDAWVELFGGPGAQERGER